MSKSLLLISLLIAIGSPQCPSHCLNCSSPTVCTVCQDEYFVASATSQFRDISERAGTCFHCENRCKTCSSETICTSCFDGEFLYSGGCYPCFKGCQTCSFNSASKKLECLTCLNRLIFDNVAKTCAMCDQSCATCEDGSAVNCRTCSRPLILSADKKCVQNPDCNIKNCDLCSSSGVCSTCKAGFFLLYNACRPCEPFICRNCAVNPDLWTDTITPVLDYALRTSYNVTPNTDLSTLPEIFGVLNFAGMNNSFQAGWTEAVMIGIMINSSYPEQEQFLASIPSHVDFYLQNAQKSKSELDQLIVARISEITKNPWTLQQYKRALDTIFSKQTSSCRICVIGYNFNSQNCVKCPNKCLRCSEIANCTICMDGYYQSAGACLPCSAPCATCTSDSACLTCIAPATLHGTECRFCNFPCNICIQGSSQICFTCLQPYMYLPIADGTCVTCTQATCVNCFLDEPYFCLECSLKYGLLNGKCVPCPANCDRCVLGPAESICLRCIARFELSQSGVCQACSANCLVCGMGKCLTCRKGSYLDQSSFTCQLCPQDCKACSNDVGCLQIADGHVSINGVVLSCLPGCKSCDSNEFCNDCLPQNFLSMGVCQPCPTGCQDCVRADRCLNCFDGYALSNSQCVACGPGCISCLAATPTSCLTCKRGLNLVNNNCVAQCPTNCLELSYINATFCQKCVPGFTLRPDGGCARCLSSCTGTCDVKNISTCLSCADGFHLRENKCVRCDSGCLMCVAGQCLICSMGFKLGPLSTGKLGCLEICKVSCATCSQGICSSCELGYSLRNNKCVANTACNPRCDACLIGTFLNSTDFCNPCPDNCASCTSETVCTVCLEGYYLSGATCMVCPSQCSKCSNPNSCIQCSAGFVKEIIVTGPTSVENVYGDKCIACSSNCKTCLVEPTQCTSCPEGSRLRNSQCFNLFTVSYEYKLDIAYSTFLKNIDSDRFLKALANKASVPISNVVIDYIKEGSTVVGGSISTDSSQQRSSVNTALSSGGLEGFTVLSSSTTLYYGDTAQTGSAPGPNVGLIVGVVLGSVALVAILVGVIYYLKFRRGSTPVPVPKEESGTGKTVTPKEIS